MQMWHVFVMWQCLCCLCCLCHQYQTVEMDWVSKKDCGKKNVHTKSKHSESSALVFVVALLLSGFKGCIPKQNTALPVAQTLLTRYDIVLNSGKGFLHHHLTSLLVLWFVILNSASAEKKSAHLNSAFPDVICHCQKLLHIIPPKAWTPSYKTSWLTKT